MALYFTKVPNAGAKDPADALVAVQIRGTLSTKDFELLAPRLDDLVERHGTLRVLIELVDFQGWTPGAAWEDVKLSVKHFGDIDRIAVLGEDRWAKGLTALASPFTSAEVRYFDVEERDRADTWVREREERSRSRPSTR